MNETTLKKTVLRSDGFTCPSCVTNIEKRLTGVEGVTDATVHFSTGRIVVNHDPETASIETLVHAVKEAGYEAAPSPFG